MSARGGDVCVGADVGGTWIRIAVWTGAARVPTVVVPTNRDLRELVTILRGVWRRRRWTRRRVAALVVASRGVWTPVERQALAHRLRGLARRVHVVSDAQAALLGALGRQPGMLILSGTGSVGVGWGAGGRWARAGGLGPFVGDEGSGFWLGREWLGATARGGLRGPLRVVHTPAPVRAVGAPGAPVRAPRAPGHAPGRPHPRPGQGDRGPCSDRARARAARRPAGAPHRGREPAAA